jgi:hypothetical protein
MEQMLWQPEHPFLPEMGSLQHRMHWWQRQMVRLERQMLPRVLLLRQRRLALLEAYRRRMARQMQTVQLQEERMLLAQERRNSYRSLSFLLERTHGGCSLSGLSCCFPSKFKDGAAHSALTLSVHTHLCSK